MNFGGVILSFSPGPALKQGTSLLSVSYDYKIGQTLKTLFAAPFSDEGRSFMVEMFKSEQAKTRYGSGASYELARAFESGHPGVGAVRYIMSKYGLAPNKAIDYITSAYGGTMVYMAEYQALVRMGIDEASAKKEAMNRAWDVIERTQQSSMVQNQPAWLRGGGAMNKLVGMFTTQPQLMLAAERSALLVARNTNTSEAWTRAARILVLNHLILPSLFKFVDHLWKAALGREPDDEEWIEWVAFCLAGPFSGWFVWGRLVDSAVPAFIRAASGNGANYFDDPTLIPAEAMFKNIGNLVKSAGNLVAGDTEEAARYLDAAAKQGIPAYRVAKELWENYGE